MKPIDPDYIRQEHRIRPGDRLHRLVSRLIDTWIDDLSDAQIEAIERHIDGLRLTHADGRRFPQPAQSSPVCAGIQCAGTDPAGT